VPSSRFSNTVKPAFFASETESGFVILGELIPLEISFLTGPLQSGHVSMGGRVTGRLISKPLRQIRQPFSSSEEMYS
jgi:hypothetical protein